MCNHGWYFCWQSLLPNKSKVLILVRMLTACSTKVFLYETFTRHQRIFCVYKWSTYMGWWPVATNAVRWDIFFLLRSIALLLNCCISYLWIIDFSVIFLWSKKFMYLKLWIAHYFILTEPLTACFLFQSFIFQEFLVVFHQKALTR